MKLRDLTTDECAALLATGRSAALVPVGSVEPHGPHLMLGTDALLGEHAALLAVERLRDRGVTAVVAPTVPYGVTDFAAGFAGAISVAKDALVAYLRAVCTGFSRAGFGHVCFVSNHLEPDHDAAVREAIAATPPGAASVASPLTRRWGRTLSDEYKRGNCHAGRYETSLVLAAGGRVLAERSELPAITTSLADGIVAGRRTFAEMGLARAYTGAPAEATSAEGDALYERLAEMIATEVLEAFERRASRKG